LIEQFNKFDLKTRDLPSYKKYQSEELRELGNKMEGALAHASRPLLAIAFRYGDRGHSPIRFHLALIVVYGGSIAIVLIILFGIDFLYRHFV
jgi:hypothetical protein